MRRRVGRLGCATVAVVALLALATPARAQEKAAAPGAETWYAQSVQQGEAGLRVINTWSLGRKLRSEVVIGGMLLVTLVNGDTYYNLLPSQGTGVAIQRAPRALADDQKGGRPFGLDADRLLARGAEKASNERLMGREVAVYRLTSEGAREEVWVTDDAQKLPVRILYTDREKGKTAETHFNWMSGLPLEDAFFEPDPRLTLEKIGYEDFIAKVKEGKAQGFPPLFTDLLAGRPTPAP